MTNGRTEISIAQFDDFVRPLSGLPVSLAWKGYGSAIFLELGQLAPVEGMQNHQRGEACIFIEWDWRVEDSTTVLYGSSNSQPKIEKGIGGLQGTKLESISIFGSVQELIINLSNGHCLRSMVMVSGDPRWNIRLLDGSWLSCEHGRL